MPIKDYGLFKGKPVAARRGSRSGSHFLIHAVANLVSFRFSVNVRSRQSPHELLYLIEDDYQHPLLDELSTLPAGYLALQGRHHPLSIDYVRGNFFQQQHLRSIPYALPGASNDLNDHLQFLISQAINDPTASVVGYGERWGPEVERDEVFGFVPGNGLHNVHMNQGNQDYQYGHRMVNPENGVWQDGALFVHFPEQQRWSALFLAFQSQSWQTDALTGEPVAGSDSVAPKSQVRAPIIPEVPSGAIRIVAAMINPKGGGQEQESVTLMNASPDLIKLDGWAIVNRDGERTEIQGEVDGGEVLQIILGQEAPLRNGGGTISLINASGEMMAGVAYTRKMAEVEGWTVVF